MKKPEGFAIEIVLVYTLFSTFQAPSFFVLLTINIVPQWVFEIKKIAQLIIPVTAAWLRKTAFAVLP
jgi:hypothetical protein